MNGNQGVFKEAFSTFHWKFANIAVIVAVIVIPDLVTSIFAYSWFVIDTHPLVSEIVPILLGGAFNLWLILSMCELQVSRFHRNEVSTFEVLKRSANLVPKAIPIMIIVTSVTMLGYGLMVFPGLIASVVFGYVYQVYYLDGETGIKALKYSARFVYENGLEAVLTVIITGVIGIVGSSLIRYIFLRLSPVSMTAISYLTGFVKAYCYIAVTQFYLKMRNEFSEEAVETNI